jgi:hypothetical protein
MQLLDVREQIWNIGEERSANTSFGGSALPAQETNMMFLLAIPTFGVALGIAAYALTTTLAPNMAKIQFAMIGQSRLAAALAAELPRVERRTMIRQRAATPVRSPAPLRAAA